jgi:ribonuclease E
MVAAAEPLLAMTSAAKADEVMAAPSPLAPVEEALLPAAPVEVETAVVEATVEASAEATVEAVAVDLPEAPEITPVAAPEPPAPAAEPVDLEESLAASGLVLVQTTGTTVAQPEAPPRLGRPRKAKAVEAGSEAPLMMVETQK